MVTPPDILGLPPEGAPYMDRIRTNAMPIAEITPCLPEMSPSIASFVLNPTKGADKYYKMLGQLGYSCKLPLRVAFQADSFPTDNFQNSYSESFLDKTANIASQGVSSIKQMFGADSGTDFIKKVGESFMKMGAENDSNMMATGGKIAYENALKAQKAIADMKNQDRGSIMHKIGTTLDSTLMGARVDFPQIWTDSSFTPSYTMTVRLYNPDPRNEDATNEYIIAPLACLLLLGLPHSKEGSTYDYPFLHKIECKGIYFLNPCFISNISVIKGGDQQSIAWNQRLGIVDVRIDFGSLYNSIVAQEEIQNVDRPTLKSYLDAMKGEKKVNKIGLSGSINDTKTIVDPNDLKLNPYPKAPATSSDEKDMTKTSRYDPEAREMEISLISNLVESYGSLENAVNTSGYNIPFSDAAYLYKTDKISYDDLASAFPIEIATFTGEITALSAVVESGNLVKMATGNLVSNASSVAGAIIELNTMIQSIGSGSFTITELSRPIINKIEGTTNVMGDLMDKIDYVRGFSTGGSLSLDTLYDQLKNAKDSLYMAGKSMVTSIATKSIQGLVDPVVQTAMAEAQGVMSNLKDGVIDNLVDFATSETELATLQTKFLNVWESEIKQVTDKAIETYLV